MIDQGDLDRSSEFQASTLSISEIDTDFYYDEHRWLIPLLLYLLIFSTWGAYGPIIYLLSKCLKENVFPELSAISFGILGGVTVGVGLFVALFLNCTVGKESLYSIILLGLIAQFSGIMLASWSTSFWYLFLTQGIIFGAGLATVVNSALRLISNWLRKSRILMVCLIFLAGALGNPFMTLWLQIFEIKDYHSALRIGSTCCVFLQAVALLMIRYSSNVVRS